jgi:hypothetical protein
VGLVWALRGMNRLGGFLIAFRGFLGAYRHLEGLIGTWRLRIRTNQLPAFPPGGPYSANIEARGKNKNKFGILGILEKLKYTID